MNDGGQDDLPEGYVTFVFTDIEGSTPLLKRLGDRYGPLIEQHDDFLRAAFTRHGGRVVSTAGDSMFAAFGDSPAAIRACCAAQQAIASHRWPADERLKVRIGLHVGLAKPYRGDYAALAVNQAARVMSAAHGEQILLTDAVLERLDDDQRSAILPVGSYRLRDFDHAPMLHQHRDWAIDGDTPVRATPTKGHNVVVPITAFFDRETESAEIVEHLRPGSVVSLIGPGGVGKSRLATQVGASLATTWPDGVWAVDLADLDDSALVVERLADVVAASRGDAEARIDDVVDRLRSRRTVLIYDGVEHHLDVCAELVDTIRSECPSVAQLATGRSPLRISGEHRIPTAPLPLVSAGASSVEQIRRADATQLFLDRARSARPDLVVDEPALRAIAEICEHVDGIPLAIEIAAARAEVMTVEEILEGLDDQFRILRSRDRSLPERQRTMEALLDWSTRLLDDEERTALRRVAVFTGAFPLEAAQVAVADDRESAHDVQDLLWALADKSLVVADSTRRPTRYRLLETVQQYGRRLLREQGEDLTVSLRVAAWLDREVGPDATDDQRWVETMHLAQSNVRAVLTSIKEAEPELAQRLAWSIGRYHDAVQSYRLGTEELTKYVDDLTAETPARVALLTELADLWLRNAALAEATTLVTEAAALQQTTGPPAWDDAGVDRTRGDVALRSDDFERAMHIAEAAVARGLSPRGAARMWNLLGIARISTGDESGAFEAFERELEIYVELGMQAKMASAHGNLAEAALRADQMAAAARHQSQCLDLGMTLGQPLMLVYSTIVAAHLAAGRQNWATAASLQAHSQRQLDDLGVRLYASDADRLEALSSAAVSHLGDTDFERARSTGIEQDPLAAVTIARDVFADVLAEADST